MARPPREQVAGGIYHVFARGNAREAVFRDAADRHTYLRLLRTAVARMRWFCLGYCLMQNHLHLLLETPMPNLAAGMQWLHGHYARRFNDRHGRVGHVFQGRYGAVRQRTDAQLQHTVRYVALNPVVAGHCADPLDYAWSSHHTVATGEASGIVDVGRLFHHLAGTGVDAAARYVALVYDDGDDWRPGPAGGGRAGGRFEPSRR